MVMGVLNEAFDVLVLKFGVQKRIYCNVSISSSLKRPHKFGPFCAVLLCFGLAISGMAHIRSSAQALRVPRKRSGISGAHLGPVSYTHLTLPTKA